MEGMIVLARQSFRERLVEPLSPLLLYVHLQLILDSC